jgi:serine/threonine protein kinase
MSSINKPLPARSSVGQYRIERLISDGGFSFVYLAYDEKGGPVAIKEYLPAALALRTGSAASPIVRDEHRIAFDRGLRCFFEESRHLVGLKHPNVVRVIDFFRANDTVYLVMEYERGRTLQEHISRHKGQLSEGFIRRTFVSLCAGLREVHSQKLLHLDIKPANIYLRSNGEPVLLDFGAARQTIGHDMPQGRSMHTPGFAAPEQYAEDSEGKLGPWTDIYAIGATMYACLSGTTLLSADRRLEKDTLRPATEAWRGKYSKQLLDIVDRCLALDLMARPQSVFTLQRELTDLTQEQNWLRELRGRLQKIVKK